MANVLPKDKQVAVLSALVEGCSIRSTERLVGVSRETVLSLLVRVGSGCDVLLSKKMVDLSCKRLEVDEAWSYVGKKQRHVKPTDNASVVGDTWTYVAIDAETKLVPCYRIGKRSAEDTQAFVRDLSQRLRNRVQISSDGLRMYIEAIELAFGADVDYAQIVKSFEVEPIGPGRYSPPKVTEVEKTIITGKPIERLISTSYVERQNLTMRMRMRRFTRLTNAFSKKLENHRAAVALHFAHYNFVAIHRTLRMTPGMAAGVTTSVWSMEELLDAALAEYTADVPF